MLVIVVAVVVVFGKTIYGKATNGLYNTFLSQMFGKGVTVDSGGESITFKEGNSKVTVENQGKLPDEFPKDFPVYPEAQITGSWTSTGDRGTGISVVWEAKGPLDKIVAFYKSELPRNGWKVTSNFDSQESSTLSFEKEDKNGFMGVAKDNDKATISVTLGSN